MPIQNPTLRDPGPTPGSAAGWSIASLCQAERIAGFGPAPERAVEDFERWVELLLQFPADSLTRGFFDAEEREDFEEGWALNYLREFSGAVLVVCTFGSADVEDMGHGWATEPFYLVWDDVPAVVGLFGVSPVEAFESWTPNIPPSSVRAVFDAGAEDAETFEGVWDEMQTL